MPRRALLIRVALAAAVLCAAAAVLITLLPGGDAPPDFGSRPGGGSPTPGAQQTRSPAEPLSVSISRIGMTARVEPVGVLEDGTVEIPGAPGAAGWYRHGAAPGQSHGSAVLVGHVDYATGKLGAFAALYDVRPGDEVTIRRDGAATARYQVTARKVIDQKRLPAEVFRRDGPPLLTLITCAPPYDEESGYQKNMIVTAEPVSG
jgi:LPXTG-site transpeptidase (sortase) family protein